MNIADAVKQIAYHWHIVIEGQRRKYSGAPYTVHTNSVRAIYASVFPDDLIGQAIAEGHDLLEDTKLTAVELFKALQSLGFRNDEIEPVISGIINLTDVYVREKFPNLNRAARKALEVKRLAIIPVREKNIKLSDLIDNTQDIVQNDPNFAKVYLREKAAVIKVLSDADARLLKRANEWICV